MSKSFNIIGLFNLFRQDRATFLDSHVKYVHSIGLIQRVQKKQSGGENKNKKILTNCGQIRGVPEEIKLHFNDNDKSIAVKPTTDKA